MKGDTKRAVTVVVVILLCLPLVAQEEEGFVKPGSKNTKSGKPVPAPAHESRDKLKAEIGELDKALAKEERQRQALGKQLDEMRLSVDQQAQALEALAVSLDGLRAEIEKLRRNDEKRQAAFAERAKAMEGLGMNMDSLGKLLDSLQERNRALEGRLDELADADSAAEQGIAKQQDLLQVLRGDINNNDEDIAALRRQVQKMSFEKSRRAGEHQNASRLMRIAKHPLAALGVALIALTVAISK